MLFRSAREGGTFTVNSFAGFETDVTANGVWFGTRSADGAIIEADSVGAGQGTLPYFVIATDATEFDSNGSLSAFAADEFFVFDSVEQVNVVAGLGANVSLAGTFQPITDDGGGNVIPLPAGVWFGLVALAVSGAIMKARRALHIA